MLTYPEIKDLLLNSEKEDWVRTSEGAFYKGNPNLHILEDKEGWEINDWQSPVFNFSDPHCSIRLFFIKYGTTLIKEFELAIVDGGRGILPMPIHAEDRDEYTKDVDRYEYNLAHILDKLGRFDYYAKKTQLNPVSTWIWDSEL